MRLSIARTAGDINAPAEDPPGDELDGMAPPEFTSSERRWFRVLFSVLFVGMVAQTFHVFEHQAQAFQKYILKFDNPHGLIGQFDLEVVHFTFNTIYFLVYVIVTAAWLKCGRKVSTVFGYMLAVLLIGLAVESYHVSEHSLRLIQFIDTGLDPSPGIIGDRFDAVLAHYVMNWVAYLPIAWVYFFEGFHVRLVRALPRAFVRRWAQSDN